MRFGNYVDWLLMTSALSLAPVPVLSLPVGRTAAGLPVGMQVGPLHTVHVCSVGAAHVHVSVTGIRICLSSSF